MPRPAVPVEPVPVLSTEDLRALLAAACAGKGFEEKRDPAIVMGYAGDNHAKAQVSTPLRSG